MSARLWMAAFLLCAAPSAALGAGVVSAATASNSAAVTESWTPLADLYAARSLPSVDFAVYASADSASSDPQISTPPGVQDQTGPEETAPVTKNPRRALLSSLLLPGSGELYLGHKGRATGFFIAEGLIWANYLGWQIAGGLRQDDYIEQAQINAGVGVGSEADDYWHLVGTYDHSSGSGPGSYEEDLRREARNEFPTDPAAQDAYVAERLPTGDRAWDWSTADLQQRYVDTRQYSKYAFNKRDWSIGLAILNRLVSAIDTQFLHRRDLTSQRSALDEGGTHLLATTTADGGGRVLLRHRF